MSKLVGAGSVLEAACYTQKAVFYLVDRHALGESRLCFQITVAAALELYIPDDVAVQFEFQPGGTDTLW